MHVGMVAEERTVASLDDFNYLRGRVELEMVFNTRC